MMENFILEACVDSVESAIAASCGGATRLELCQNLVIGGTTPGPKLFEEIRKHTDIKIHALIRPRFGDFFYTDYEYSIIKEEIKIFNSLGAEGVVTGMLTPEGKLDLRRMYGLMEAAEGMSVTLHRAFDVCSDPYEALGQAIELGIDTILTSGQKNTCTEGALLIKKLTEISGTRICIQAGGGVNAEVIRKMYPLTKVYAYHMSGKVVLDSGMEYRREGVNMGLPSLSEYSIFRTDERKIAEARKVLEAL